MFRHLPIAAALAVTLVADGARAEETPPGEADYRALAMQLGHADFHVRERAMQAILAAEGAEAVTHLSRAAASDDFEVRWRAVAILSSLVMKDDEQLSATAFVALRKVADESGGESAKDARAALLAPLAPVRALGGRIESTDGEVTLVHLEQRGATDDHLKSLRHWSKIRFLYLARTNVSSDGMRYLAALNDLERLSLWNTRLSDKGLAHLAACTSLAALDVHATLITDDGLKHLAGLTKLSFLNLGECRYVTDEGLQHLSELPSLKRLDLHGVKITNTAFDHLKEIGTLADLNLAGCTNFTAAGADKLAEFSSLRSLDLRSTSLRESTIERLRTLLPRCEIKPLKEEKEEKDEVPAPAREGDEG